VWKNRRVQTQTVQGDMLRALDCKAVGKAPVNLQEYPTDPDAITAVIAGKASLTSWTHQSPHCGLQHQRSSNWSSIRQIQTDTSLCSPALAFSGQRLRETQFRPLFSQQIDDGSYQAVDLEPWASPSDKSHCERNEEQSQSGGDAPECIPCFFMDMNGAFRNT
jgi:hypothetical protein